MSDTASIDALPERVKHLMPYFEGAARLAGVDPLLLAAICERETRCGEARGYLPWRSPMGRGDNGHGRGYMQVDDRFHVTFVQALFNGVLPLWGMPSFNILYGAELLAANMRAFKGELAPSVAAYNAGVRSVEKALRKLPPGATVEDRQRAADEVTTGKDYATAVIQTYRQFTLLSKKTKGTA